MAAKARKQSDAERALAALAEHRARHSSDEKKLRALATKLRTAAKRIDLAATYAGDGATITADAIGRTGRPGERSAASLALEVVRALNMQRWRS